MGVVYLANDPEIERPVAIKTVRPEALRGESAAEIEARFLKEAKLAGRLQHPSIVTVYDVGRDRDVCFIAMEYIDGKPLTRYLAAADTLPLAGKIGIIRQVAEALAHAHERGVLHRDIKPGNILIAKDGRVKVTDFGIGKFTAAATSDLTRTGQMVGSPAYMSPEQIRGEKVDSRSDLFSLGVVLYELLTGVRPFPGDSITTLVYQILHTEPRDPRELKADLPMATREVMACLLAKQPAKRPASAREFVSELKRIEKFQRDSEMTRRAVVAPPPGAGETPAAEPPGPPPASAFRENVRPDWSRPEAGGSLPIILLATAAVLVAGFLLLRERGRTQPSPPTSPEPRPAAAAMPSPAPEASAPPAEETPSFCRPPDPTRPRTRRSGLPGFWTRPGGVPRRGRRLPTVAPPPEEKVASAEPPPRPAAPDRRIARNASTRCTRRGAGCVSRRARSRRASTWMDATSGSPTTGTTAGEAGNSSSKSRARTTSAWSCRAIGPCISRSTSRPRATTPCRSTRSSTATARCPTTSCPPCRSGPPATSSFSSTRPMPWSRRAGARSGPSPRSGRARRCACAVPWSTISCCRRRVTSRKLVRILVAENAGEDRARVEEKLKSE